MDCSELQKFIHAYLDGEIDEEDRVAYAAHIEQCQRCQGVARFERAFRARLSHIDQPIRLPDNLRRRVGRALDTAEWQRHWWSRPWPRRLFPAVGVVTLAAVAAFWQQSSDHAWTSSLAEASIQLHRRALPLDVKASDLGRIQRFFSDKVPFVVRPPRIAHPQARLVGARLSHLGAHDGVLLQYDVNGRRVSVFVSDPNAVPSQAEHGARGYQVFMFRRNGIGYAVASEMDRHGLARLVTTAGH